VVSEDEEAEEAEVIEETEEDEETEETEDTEEAEDSLLFVGVGEIGVWLQEAKAIMAMVAIRKRFISLALWRIRR